MAIEESNDSEVPFSSMGDGLVVSEGYSKVDVAWSSNWIVSCKKKKKEVRIWNNN